MKYALAFFVTAFLAAGAWAGHSIGNDFMLFLFGFLAFAPVTAIIAVKSRVF